MALRPADGLFSALRRLIQAYPGPFRFVKRPAFLVGCRAGEGSENMNGVEKNRAIRYTCPQIPEKKQR